MLSLESKEKNYWISVSDDDLLLLDKVVQFLRNEYPYQLGGELWTQEYFEWKLGEKNPGGKGFMSVALFNGIVIGVVTLTRKRILLNGVKYDGGEVGDSYSSIKARRNFFPYELSKHDSNPKSYLNKSIFGRLASDVRVRAENHGVSTIYGVPNKNAYPGWVNRLDYFEAKECNNMSFSRPGNYYLVNKFIKLKNILFIFNIINRIIIGITSFLYNFKYKNINFICDKPENYEIDKLWEKVKPQKGFSLIRDEAYWKYRYLTRPKVEYTLFSYYLDRELIGLVSVRMIEDNKFMKTICLSLIHI